MFVGRECGRRTESRTKSSSMNNEKKRNEERERERKGRNGSVWGHVSNKLNMICVHILRVYSLSRCYHVIKILEKDVI